MHHGSLQCAEACERRDTIQREASLLLGNKGWGFCKDFIKAELQQEVLAKSYYRAEHMLR